MRRINTSLLKRLLGSYLNGHHGQYRSARDNGHGNSINQRKNHGNNDLLRNQPQGVQCPRCQAFNEPGSRFCGQCGQGIQNTVCSCGAAISAGAKFCGQCGSTL